MAYNYSNTYGDSDLYSSLFSNLSTAGIGTPTGGAKPGAGFNPYSIASILGGLGVALSPEQYNRRGTRVPTWQEKLSSFVMQKSKAEQIAQALNAPGGGMNTNALLMAYLLGR